MHCALAPEIHCTARNRPDNWKGLRNQSCYCRIELIVERTVERVASRRILAENSAAGIALLAGTLGGVRVEVGVRCMG